MKPYPRLLCLAFLAIIVITATVCLYRLEKAHADTNPLPKIEVISQPLLPPILQRIAMCESWQQQFNKDGTVFRGYLNHNDIGYFQINTKYWLAESKKLGYDIFTLKGNQEMGLWIYDHYGTKPWDWSKHCWG